MIFERASEGNSLRFSSLLSKSDSLVLHILLCNSNVFVKYSRKVIKKEGCLHVSLSLFLAEYCLYINTVAPLPSWLGLDLYKVHSNVSSAELFTELSNILNLT